MSRIFVLSKRADLVWCGTIIDSLNDDIALDLVSILRRFKLDTLDELASIVALQVSPHIILTEALQNVLTLDLRLLSLLKLVLCTREVNDLHTLQPGAQLGYSIGGQRCQQLRLVLTRERQCYHLPRPSVIAARVDEERNLISAGFRACALSSKLLMELG